MIVNDGVNNASRLVLIRIAIVIVNMGSPHAVVIGALLVHDKATNPRLASLRETRVRKNSMPLVTVTFSVS